MEYFNKVKEFEAEYRSIIQYVMIWVVFLNVVLN